MYPDNYFEAAERYDAAYDLPDDAQEIECQMCGNLFLPEDDEEICPDCESELE